MDAIETGALREEIIAEALRTVCDPEIPVNIYDLGLVYEIRVEPAGDVHVKMTLTAPACPVAAMLVADVDDKIRRLPGVQDVKVELVWEPPWEPSRMSEAAKLQLGLI